METLKLQIQKLKAENVNLRKQIKNLEANITVMRKSLELAKQYIMKQQTEAEEICIDIQCTLSATVDDNSFKLLQDAINYIKLTESMINMIDTGNNNLNTSCKMDALSLLKQVRVSFE